MIVDAVLDQMLIDGCTAAQIVNAIRADRADAQAKREAARLRRGAGGPGQVESGLRVAVGLIADVSGEGRKPVSAEGLQHPRVKLAVARKALPFCKLTPNAQEVFAALLDFCHAETLRCYPGLDHIALKLGRSGQVDPRRQIRRGIGELVDAGLLRVAAHAGLRHSNAYFPQWEKLAAIAAAYEAGEGGVAAALVRVQSDSPDRIVLQSQKKNLPSVGRRGQRAKQPDRAQRQLPLVSVLAGGKAAEPAPAGMPREQAGIRVMQALSRHLAGKPPRFIERTRADIGAELLEAAISAEVRSKGSGISVILDGLGPGPPGAMPEVSDGLLAVLKRG